jgi:GxxExxY protein
MPKECAPDLIDAVLTAATTVHRILGPGLLESIYEAALMCELHRIGIAAEKQVPFLVSYRGTELGLGFRADIVVSDCLILEIKSAKKLDRASVAQLLTYLRVSNIRTGYILNFSHQLLKHGIKRVSNFSPP